MILNQQNQAIKEDILVKINFLDCVDQSLKEYYQKKLIKPAEIKRDWMSQDKQNIIYHCLPVTTASQTGWNILSPHELIVNWNGGKSPKDLSIIDVTSKSLDYENVKQWSESRTIAPAFSHVAIGILTFSMPFIVETPPGWGLLITGPSNMWIDGIAPIEAIVETNWLPFTFAINWKITTPNKNIKIPLHFPIGRIIPFPLNLNEKTEIVMKNIEPELFGKYEQYARSRIEHSKNINPNKVFQPQKFYKNGTDSSGCPYKGFHKLFYKFKDIK